MRLAAALLALIAILAAHGASAAQSLSLFGVEQSVRPPAAYSFQRANFHTYVTSTSAGNIGSGQTWTSDEPWLSTTGPLPGVDTSVGYPLLLPLVNPTDNPVFLGNGFYGIFPSAVYCSYETGTSPKRIFCNFNNTSANFYIGGFDYTASGDCTELYIDAAGATGTITIDSTHTGYGAQAVSNCDVASGMFIQVQSGATANIVFTNSQVDGAAPNGTGALSDHYTHSQSAAVVFDTTGSIYVNGIAMLNLDARPIGSGFPSSAELDNSYIENFIMGAGNGSGAPYEHGEVWEVGAATLHYDHDVLISGSNQPPGNTALIDLNDGLNTALTSVNVTISNSLLIAENTTTTGAVYYTTASSSTGPGNTSSATIELASLVYNNVEITNTWIDTVGTRTCIQNAGGTALAVAGDLNQTYSGGYLNVTSLQASSVIYPGTDGNGFQTLLQNVAGLNAGTQINACGAGCPGTPGTGGIGVYKTNNTAQSMAISGGKTAPAPINGTLTPNTSGSSSVYSLETGLPVYYLAVQNATGCT